MSATKTIIQDQREIVTGDQILINDSLKYRSMASRQKTIAAFVIILPLLLFVFAIYFSIKFGIPAFYIYLWIAMHLLGMLGISVGFHRLASHGSFKPHKSIKMLLLISGSASAQGSVIFWASHHRKHHHKTDKKGDVHSPYVAEDGTQYASKLKGLFHAHTGWLFEASPSNPVKYCKDLLKDKDVLFVNRHYYLWILVGIILPGFIALLYEASIESFLLGLLFGGFARLCSVQHATWLINSVTHMFGNRPYKTNDNSTNSFWLSIPTVGEGWHNNHHAFPYSAKVGLEWWQIDMGYYFLLVLKFFGLISDIKTPTKSDIESKKNLKNFENE